MTTAVVILCGGRGMRAYPHTLEVPKPLLLVGERPVLQHVMDIYAQQGLTRFVLAGGYKVEMLTAFARSLPDNWSVEVVDTGEETGTGDRIRRCRDRLGETFLATYGDGLGDVDLRALLGYHNGHEGCATITAVPLRSQYGTIEFDRAGKVKWFHEKPLLSEHLINAGFFAFDQMALDTAGDDLEGEVLPALAAAGQLYARRHDGFWRSLDTYKDAIELAALCREEVPPWSG